MRTKILFFLLIFFALYAILSFAATTGTVSITLNVSDPWWNDSILVNGTALYSGGGPISGNVSIRLNNKVYCTTETIANGNYNCSFGAPLELGDYAIMVDVTNSTGSTFTNTSSLTVRARYGETPIGKVERVVYEEPMMIQEPSGTVKIAWARIMVWRG
jgi:hypothetical protein